MRFTLKRRILHFFFPTRCPICSEIIGAQERFCAECAPKLSVYSGNFRIDGADSFTAAFDYDDNIKPAVFLLKRGIGGNAAYALGSALADRLRKEGAAEKADVIIPVPMHRRDLRRRGFNQSVLIAGEVGRELNIPVDKKAVTKLRRTRAQKELDGLSRAVNLKNAFSADSERLKGRHVLLLDDICTTGSTMRELTALINKSGAASVCCACCCKTRRK